MSSHSQVQFHSVNQTYKTSKVVHFASSFKSDKMSKRVNVPPPTDPAEEVPPKRYKKRLWRELQTFENEEQKRQFFKENDFWKIRDVRKAKTFYYCNAVSIRKGARCPAEIYMLDGIANKQVLMTNDEAHDHDRPDQVPRKAFLSDNVKRVIGGLVDQGVKPRMISHTLREEHGVIPDHSQVCIIKIVKFKCEMFLVQ